MQHAHEKTWIEISESALRANLALAQAQVSPAQVIPVLKANAYGHGLKLVKHALADANVPFFAVDSLEEARVLRGMDQQAPILVMGYIPLAYLAEALDLRLSFVCSKVETVQALKELTSAERQAHIHLEIETGLHRQGADSKTLEALLRLLESSRDRIVVEGVCTHFANVEEIAVMNQYPMLQEERFLIACDKVRAAGHAPKWRHAACSAAIWLRPTSYLDAVRYGISLYGIWSSEPVRAGVKERFPQIDLKPVLTWKTLVAEVKTVQSGEPIGYGLTEKVSRETVLAVLPIGYADGFDRGLSSKGEVLIRGQKCRVLGRVCMNMCMVDATDVPGVTLEDEVVIFGTQGKETLSPADWERVAPEEIAYAYVARLRSDIPRMLVQ